MLELVESQNENEISCTYIKFSIVNFILNNQLGDRTVSPVYSQLRAVLQLNKDYLRVHLTPDKFIELYVELFETC